MNETEAWRCIRACSDYFRRRDDSPRAARDLLAAAEILAARAPAATAPQDGAALIRTERERQQQVEGWTPQHDDDHDDGEMASAALGYIGASQREHGSKMRMPATWPWALAWWKPSDDPIRNLVKAGALIAAEIDRLQRTDTPAAAPSSAQPAAVTRLTQEPKA